MNIHFEQLATLEQDGWRRFEKEMTEHAVSFSPQLCAAAGDHLQAVLRAGMSRAKTYGFTNRGPIRLFIEMIFLCGNAFDTDPQYPAFGDALRASEEQMVRAHRIHEEHNAYVENVAGSGNKNMRMALEKALLLLQTPGILPSNSADEDLRREMTRAFPEKSLYIGPAGLDALIGESRIEALRYGFATFRQIRLLALLRFAFGHGCTSDPLYPWIAKTLQDETIGSPSERAACLEADTIVWLEQVLARPVQGSHA